MPDMARSPEHKVDICQQCGDQGFSNAFVYCVKCLEFPVHRYCLDIIPDTLDEFVRWICDKCMSKHPNKFIIQSSEANQDCSKRVKKQSDGSIIGKEMQGACAKIDLTKTPHLARDSSVGKVNGGEKLDEQINQTCAKQAVGSTQDGQPSGGRPVSEIIWEGCFKICNKDYEIFDGLVAHLSIKACEKVYREATLFPPMLKLEMLPKSAIWPNSFRNSGPTDENIALYFFPANPKCERGFEYLVDILMEEEFAMKTTLMNAELLVFTSKELPRQYWRFQGKYYLWGVFRGKQPSSKGPNKR